MFSWPIKLYILGRFNGIFKVYRLNRVVKFYAMKVYLKYTTGIFKAN